MNEWMNKMWMEKVVAKKKRRNKWNIDAFPIWNRKVNKIEINKKKHCFHEHDFVCFFLRVKFFGCEQKQKKAKKKNYENL